MIVKDRRVVVTGKIAGESRQTAEAKLREEGAIVQSAVGKDTDILVTGAAVGASKMNKARALGVEIIPWEEAFRNSGAGRKVAPPPRAPLPNVRQWAPMLCTSARDLPSGGNWTFEIKWDGQRGVATIKDGKVSIQSRTGKTDLTERYPWVAEELSELPDCVLDGELVEMEGVPRFMVFDILETGGENITGLRLKDRQDYLNRIVKDGVYVGISCSFSDGQGLLDYVVYEGMEGVVAKHGSSRYVEGGRNDTWLKIKVRREQEFVVLGYTAGEGHRAWAFGALILGYYEGDEIRYAGKVGTGFDDDCLAMLMAEMEPMIRTETIEDERSWIVPKELYGSTFIYPGIVVQVAFQKWTEDGRLWHPSYLRLRDDKLPTEVVRES